MNILLIGEPENLEEAKLKFGSTHQYTLMQDHQDAERFITGKDLILDFVLDEELFEAEIYIDKTKSTVLINTAKISLAEISNITGHQIKARLFGFNGLPTFLNRSVLELSVLRKEDELKLTELCKQLNTDFLVVDDRVGMVTPRVICMIINEAYFTVQEGTASREDIDMAMKLGTNYPYGPFEWCQRIGIKHVYKLLEAVYNDTRDERYKVCPLLKKEYLKV